MLKITRLEEKDIERYIPVVTDAYPDDERENTDGLVEYLKKSLANDKHIEYYQVTIGDQTVGTMRFLSYRMNMRHKTVDATGLGLVAVSPLHCKKGVAKAMMEFYIKESDRAGIDFLILYPFNLAFYKNTGFGYGTKQRMYKLLPSSFPSYRTENLSFMKKEESAEVLACFQKFSSRTNGMIYRREGAFDNSIDSVRNRIVLYREGSEIEGYLAYHYEKEKPDYEYDCNMIVTELVYNSGKALQSLLGFIANQREQAIRVHINTQDEALFFLLDNPLNGEKETFKTDQLEAYTTALSMMYRVTNVARLFTNYSDTAFGHDSFVMKLTIKDSLHSPNNGSTYIEFREGFPEVLPADSQCDFQLTMDVADFSSLFAGAVSLKKLVLFGLTEISDEAWLDKADKTLSFHEKPQCFTGF